LGNANGWQVIYSGTFHMSGGTFDLNGNTNNMEPQIDGTGTITNTNAAAATLRVYPNGTKTFGGDIVDGTGVVGVQYSNDWLGANPDAVWTLSGNNTYSGPTTIDVGTLKAGSATAFSPNSIYTVGTSGNVATLDLAGYSLQIPGLQGSGAGGRVTSGAGPATLTVNNDATDGNADYTFAGVLRDGTVEEGGGVLSLTKTGSKTLTLTGASTYSGGTIVSGGKLLINNTTGSGTGTGSVTVNTGATLGGTGTITGAIIVNAGGHLAPGASVGILNAGTTVTMAADSVYNWEYDSVANAGDKVVVTGSLTLDSGWNLALAGATAPAFGSQYDLYIYGSFSGSLAAVIDYSGVIDWPSAWIGQDAGKIYLAFGPKPGDANGDGVVDAADYIRLKQYFGQSTAAGTNGDFNGDGMVDWTDLQILMAEFSTRSVGGAPTAPEPATLGLLAIGALAVLRRRRRSCLRP
jgi:autotransporter-associated beta strand protein